MTVDDALAALREARRPRTLAEERGGTLRPDEREREALAQIIEQARREGGEQALAPMHALFSGEPDTPCRTTYRREAGDWSPGSMVPAVECVEVPLDELRDTFDEAERVIEGTA